MGVHPAHGYATRRSTVVAIENEDIAAAVRRGLGNPKDGHLCAEVRRGAAITSEDDDLHGSIRGRILFEVCVPAQPASSGTGDNPHEHGDQAAESDSTGSSIKH